ncbi:hypothetical protein CW304_32160 [Bacillus sp. UFRGS-B20]|nr:hypothetical protein CW304_32160 [Bacillus sp. UFRGS-B20]
MRSRSPDSPGRWSQRGCGGFHYPPPVRRSDPEVNARPTIVSPKSGDGINLHPAGFCPVVVKRPRGSTHHHPPV